MDNFKLRLADMLGFMDVSDSSSFDESHIEDLEELISDCIDLQRSNSKDRVEDSIYDILYYKLKEVKPQSEIFSNLWEEDGDISEYTKLLKRNPMMSIETAKSYACKEYFDWLYRMPFNSSDYLASYKINGHGVRVVYEDGELVSATSRARSSGGRDLTRQMRIILGDRNESLNNCGLVELRGEVCLKICNLGKAREFNPNIKSPFSAVASLIRPSSSTEEVALLDFICYGLIIEDFQFETREEEFQRIESFGLLTSGYMLLESVSGDDLARSVESLIGVFEENYEEFGYFCDGVVIELNNKELFESLGEDGNHKLGNIAMKVGVWKQDMYTGYIQKIEWTKGKSKLSPVAIVASQPDIAIFDEKDNISNIEDLGVLTAQGNYVSRVPLYEPKNILILDAYEGEPLCFRYGGEAGVVPCFEDGRTLNEDAVRNIISEEGEHWVYL